MALILHPHPQYGGTMNNPLVYDLYHRYHKLGCTVVRFNFAAPFGDPVCVNISGYDLSLRLEEAGTISILD